MFTDFFNSLVDLFDDQSDWIQWAVSSWLSWIHLRDQEGNKALF